MCRVFFYVGKKANIVLLEFLHVKIDDEFKTFVY